MLVWSIGVLGCADDASPGAQGEPCTSDRDCDGLSCVAEIATAAATPQGPEDLAPLALHCEGPVGDDRGAPCETSDDCERGICLLAGACAAPCADESDCDASDPARCQAVFARAGLDALQSLNACVQWTDLPPEVDVDHEILPDALTDGDSEIALPHVDRGASTLYFLSRQDDLWPTTVQCRPGLCIHALRADGDVPEILFDADSDFAAEPPPRLPVATGDYARPAAIAFWKDAADELTSTAYVATVTSEAPGGLRITRLRGDTRGRQLDLNVFYVGTDTLGAEGSRGPPTLERAFEVVDDILGQADIFVGEVRQIEVPGRLPAQGTIFPDGDSHQGFATLRVRFGVLVELPGLFELSAGAGDRALDLFFVHDIESRASGELYAEAGGIPGPPAMHGTPGSGIAIAADMLAGDPEELGRTLAHEIAHYLGLFHTSERDGSVREALADTPECRPEHDIDGDGLSAFDCEGRGTDNLMFWSTAGGQTLTEEQAAILRASPLLW